jgi:hypothetical protein
MRKFNKSILTNIWRGEAEKNTPSSHVDAATICQTKISELLMSDPVRFPFDFAKSCTTDRSVAVACDAWPFIELFRSEKISCDRKVIEILHGL